MFLSISCCCLLLTWLYSATEAASICSAYDAVHGTPISTHTTCSIYQADNDNCRNCANQANSGCQQWKSDLCDHDDDGLCYPSVCPGFVGMNLTYRCKFEGAQLYKYQDANGVYQYLNGPSVNYGLLLPDHAGLYECRDSMNYTVYAQNLTVNEEVRIGSVWDTCGQFYMDHKTGCCLSASMWSFNTEQPYLELAVYSNPTEYLNVTVEQLEWLVDKETRNEVSLGFYTERHPNNPVIWRVYLGNVPSKVTKVNPLVQFRVTASNAKSSHSICQIVSVEGSGGSTRYRVIVENSSHPEDVSLTEGEEAVFQCFVSYSEPPSEALILSVLLEVSYPEAGLQHTCITEFGVARMYNKTSGNCSHWLQVERKDTVPNSLSHNVVYTVRIPRTRASLNGSTVACSLTKEYLQWRRVATLTVHPALAVRDGGHNSTIAVSVVVALLTLLGVVSLAVGTTVTVLLRKRKKNSHSTQEKIPLATSHDDDSPTTPTDQTSKLPHLEVRLNDAETNGTGEEDSLVTNKPENNTTNSSVQLSGQTIQSTL